VEEVDRARWKKSPRYADREEGFPAFIILVMIALSYSIATGLAFGFLSFVIFKVIRMKFREIKPVMWASRSSLCFT